jgi:hypothetical protein
MNKPQSKAPSAGADVEVLSSQLPAEEEVEAISTVQNQPTPSNTLVAGDNDPPAEHTTQLRIEVVRQAEEEIAAIEARYQWDVLDERYLSRHFSSSGEVPYAERSRFPRRVNPSPATQVTARFREDVE